MLETTEMFTEAYDDAMDDRDGDFKARLRAAIALRSAAKAIRIHVARGATCRAPKALGLVDAYNDAAKAAKAFPGLWETYCRKEQAAIDHNGIDFYA